MFKSKDITAEFDGTPTRKDGTIELVSSSEETVSYDIPEDAVLSEELEAALDGKVRKGALLAQWNAYAVPYFAKKQGTVKLENFIDDVTVREVRDEATGLTQVQILETAGTVAKPHIVIVGASGEKLADYIPPAKSIVTVKKGQEVNPADIVATLEIERKSRDITGGLPRVAELFEARKPKDCSIIAEIDGVVEFGKDYKAKQLIKVKAEEGVEREYLVPKGKLILVQDGDVVHKGDVLTDGSDDPHDILRVKGLEAFAEHMVNEIQAVYRLQGVEINDKHIEVIVRQMLQKMEVTDAGDTTLTQGEQVDQATLDKENAKAVASGGRPATATRILLGITKASLQTDSFISAASFQETTRVLTESAVSGRKDDLIGLKENVIVGRLIPAGTGAVINRMRALAARRDREMMENSETPAALPVVQNAPEE